MKRYIFLDIDGVMNTYSSCGSKVVEKKYVDLLNQLLDLSPEIIISSSWANEAIEPLKKQGLNIPIIGVTRKWYGNYYNFGCRGDEIEDWLQEYVRNVGIEDYEYVIFDDVPDMLMRQEENYVEVNGHEGLSQDNINKAREILC